VAGGGPTFRGGFSRKVCVASGFDAGTPAASRWFVEEVGVDFTTFHLPDEFWGIDGKFCDVLELIGVKPDALEGLLNGGWVNFAVFDLVDVKTTVPLDRMKEDCSSSMPGVFRIHVICAVCIGC
jgi:hypothetical protein